MKTLKKKSLIGSAFPRYSGMIIAASIASTISSFVDGCITGKALGTETMAAFGIALPFVLILVVVSGMILSSGGSICTSKAIGSNDRRKADSNFTACLLMGLEIGAAAMLVFFLLPDRLISLTGSEGDLASEASAYLRGYGFGAVPTILLTILMNYADLDGNENLAFIAVAVMTAADILLDLLLGVRMQLGLFGMALATSISYICSIAVFLAGFLRGKSSFSLRFHDLKAESLDILRTGYPSALNTVLVSMRSFCLNSILMELAGSDAVSALSFQSNFNQIFIAVASGISTAVSVMTGIFIGEKDRSGVRTTVRTGFRYGILQSAVLAVILYAAAPLFTSLLLNGSGESIRYAEAALQLYSLSMPVSVLCITLISYYQTTGDRKIANTIAIGHGLILPLGCAFLFSGIFGLNGVWISTLAAEILMLAILALILWFRTGKLPRSPEDLAVINGKTFPWESSVFVRSLEAKDLSTEGFSRQLTGFLASGQYDQKVLDSCRSFCSDLFHDSDPSSACVDVQCRRDPDGFCLNIRCSGRSTDTLLNSDKWKTEKKAAYPGLEIGSHYSAGISFVSANSKSPRN